MKKINNILWKLLGVVVALLTGTSRSFADDNETFLFCGGKKNYYVKKCGSNEVGLNWLKTAASDGSSILSTTSSDNVYEENVNNFRKYIASAGTTEATTITYHIDPDNPEATSEAVVDAHNQLLRLCPPYLNGQRNTFECEPCPNAGILPDEPSVETNYDQDHNIAVVAHTWKFYTIADCFLQDYSDSTGTFYYIDSFARPSQCYYKPKSTEIEGTLETITENSEEDFTDDQDTKTGRPRGTMNRFGA